MYVGVLSATIRTQDFQDAEFAVQELQQLSDSGIYTSLSLHQIVSVKHIPGIYYNNVAFELELKSPYFKSKQSSESFHMIVMKHKVDNITTLAIDTFPVMDDAAIEQFYIQKVETNRERRIKAFERLYQDSLAQAAARSKSEENAGSGSVRKAEMSSVSHAKLNDQEDKLNKLSIQELHALLKESSGDISLRNRVQRTIKSKIIS